MPGWAPPRGSSLRNAATPASVRVGGPTRASALSLSSRSCNCLDYSSAYKVLVVAITPTFFAQDAAVAFAVDVPMAGLEPCAPGAMPSSAHAAGTGRLQLIFDDVLRLAGCACYEHCGLPGYPDECRHCAVPVVAIAADLVIHLPAAGSVQERSSMRAPNKACQNSIGTGTVGADSYARSSMSAALLHDHQRWGVLVLPEGMVGITDKSRPRAGSSSMPVRAAAASTTGRFPLPRRPYAAAVPMKCWWLNGRAGARSLRRSSSPPPFGGGSRRAARKQRASVQDAAR